MKMMGMFEKECETEEVDDDLPATQWFVSPQNSLATYHLDEACPVNVLLCDSSSDLVLMILVIYMIVDWLYQVI